MADPRATPEDVRGVINTNADKSVITGYIDDAHLEVKERVSAANAGYSDERMKKLEKYLAAHLVRFLWDRQEQTVDVADVRRDFSGAFGESLTATSAGQTFLDADLADVFDPTVSDEEPEGDLFVTRDRFVATAERGGDDRVEGAEHER